MNEELINQLVHRILSEPAFQALLQGNGNGAGNKAVKPAALVLLNYVPDFERVLSAVKTRWGAEYTLTILPSESVAKANPALPEDMNWITPQDALTKTDWQKIIVPACSANTLAKAALGLRDNPLSELIGRGITQGQPIELVTEYLGFTAQTPKAYLELYEGYLQKIKSYGVKVYTRIGDEKTAAEPTQDVIRFEKKFLGDKDAYGFPEASRVFVKRLTVISPLARDTLKIRRIELCTDMEREGGRR
ncbi:flavoprotein [Desulfosporosinus metallidurans]|uniref:Uncharacterized protein n=1 Tax=Desulfosporosinus metallidurans TaxID=1888891 RepID=A0A1Q8QEQ0_9FIRM|nr:flavoprotein [Desulfosporosinus metallidurans]OLN25762.1 hypothetical protein DSOL_5238 [Desulfosporosinus metallidurans]